MSCCYCTQQHHQQPWLDMSWEAPTQEEPSDRAIATYTLPHVTELTTGLNHSTSEFSTTEFNVTGSTLYVDMSRPVLSHTALAMVFNPHDLSASTKLRFVMDSGSQCSYLTQHPRGTPCLQTTNRQRLAIATFGYKRTEPQLCEVVHVTVQMKVGDSKSIDLFVVPHICEHLMKQPMDKCLEVFPHISGLELAHDL